MKTVIRWPGAAGNRDPRDGDPYLEALARQMLLLRSGQTPRQGRHPGVTRR